MPAGPPSLSSAGAATKPSSTVSEAKGLQAFLKTHAAELEQLSNGKVRCLLTNTDLPARLSTLQQYWLGPALARAREAISDSELAEQYPALQPHKSNKNMLYCTLTRLTVNRRRSHVEAHVAGKKYQKEREKEEERRRAREERERKRREKESGKDDDVAARLPAGLLEEEEDENDNDDVDQQQDEDEDEEAADTEEEEEEEEEEQEEEEDDMPIVRKVAVPAIRKRKSREGQEDGHDDHYEQEDDSDEDDQQATEEEEEDEVEEEEEEEAKRPAIPSRRAAARYTNGTTSNGHTNKRHAVSDGLNRQPVNGSKQTGQAAGKQR